jgi:hypothetical protein
MTITLLRRFTMRHCRMELYVMRKSTYYPHEPMLVHRGSALPGMREKPVRHHEKGFSA